MIKKVLDCPLSHRVVRQFDCGELRAQMRRDHLEIIKTDDCHVVRNAEPELLDRVIGAHCHCVVEAEQRGRPLGKLHQLDCATIPFLGSNSSAVDEAWVERHTIGRKRLLVALQTPEGRGNWVDIIDETDSPMTFLQQHLGRRPAALHLVGHNRWQRAIFHITIQQHRWHLPERSWERHRPVIHRRVYEALDLSLKHHLHRDTLDVGIAVGVDHQQHFGVGPRGILRALDDLAGMRRGHDLVRDEPNCMRALQAQSTGHRIGSPAKFFNSCPHAIARFLRNVDIGYVVDDEGDGRL